MAPPSGVEGARLPELRRDPRTLGDLLESSTKLYPSNKCMQSSTQTLTYSQVDALTSAMALSLYTATQPGQSAAPILRVGESIVALWHPRGIPCLLAELAIAKSGAAWLPFDFDAPISRVAVCLKDAAVKIMITSEEGRKRLETSEQLPEGLLIFTPEELQVPRGSSSLAHKYKSPRERGLNADDKAYLIYTSGSTGVPKGITITHRNAVHYLLCINTIYNTNASDVMLQTASVAFDLSVEEIWLLLTVGGSLYVASQQEVIDVEGLPRLLQTRGITVIDTVPTLLAMISSGSSSSSDVNQYPALRIIILGGEALPKSVLADWSAPHRHIYNTYGPTETTIVATTWLCDAKQDVTIGQPIPNYIAYVVDPETMEVVPRGVQGELLIGGMGVAQGYYKRPELTAAKFIANKYTSELGDGGSLDADTMYPVLYRTGDACMMAPSGDIFFRGRIDDQVKIRGFRVELGEIESHIDTLGAQFGIQKGQVAVVVSPADADLLVAFLVLDIDLDKSKKGLRKAALLTALRKVMPAYMVPHVFLILPSMPRLAASGKIDRNALKAKAGSAEEYHDEDDDDVEGTSEPGGNGGPSTDVERILHEASCRIFKTKSVPLDSDFFNDLGGHSLAVSQFVSSLRKSHPNTALSGVSFLDLYSTRTIKRLAELVESRIKSSASKGGAAGAKGMGSGLESGPSDGLPSGLPVNGRFTPPPWQRRYLCGLAQALSVPFFLLLTTAKWLGLFLAADLNIRLQCPHKVFRKAETHKADDYADDYITYEKCNYSSRQTIGVITLTFVGTFLAFKVLVVVLKWLVIGRTKPGVYPMWGQYFFRVWFVSQLINLSENELFYGSPLLRLYFNALGANIAQDASVNSMSGDAPDLITIGENATVGNRVMFETTHVTGDHFIIGHCTVKAGANIGALTVVGRDVVVGEGSIVGPLSSLHDGCVIPDYQEWEGSPVGFVKDVSRDAIPVSAHKDLTPAFRFFETLAYFIAYIGILVATLAPVFPAFFFLTNTQQEMYNDSNDDAINETLLITPNSWNASWPVLLVLIWPTSCICLFLTLAVGVVARWTLFPFRLQPCTISVHSWLAFRLWIMSKLVEIILESCQTLYATLWMGYWYRLLGVDITLDTEVSTKIDYFDLVSIGKLSFVADDAILGEDDVSYGWLTIGRVKAGIKSFFGNDCVVPHSSTLGDNVLLGVKSVMPRSKVINSNEIHFGSPSILLPTKQVQQLDVTKEELDTFTYRPSRLRYVLRLLFELLVLPIPLLILIFFGYVGSDYVAQFYIDGQLMRAAMAVISTGPILAGTSVALMLIVKWAWMGAYRPGKYFMWSWWAIRNEAFQHVFLSTCGSFCLRYFAGTPMLPNFLRLFGLKIGIGCYLATHDIPEFDCVTIGDYCVINHSVGLQTHLFEDRICKIGKIKIGNFCHVGVGSTVLYDTWLKSGCNVGPQSCVMKGEVMDGNTYSLGIPTRTTNAPTSHARRADDDIEGEKSDDGATSSPMHKNKNRHRGIVDLDLELTDAIPSAHL